MWIYSIGPFLRIDMSNVSIFIDCLSQSNRLIIYLIVLHNLFLKVVQEYERAVMFRLGRILGGAKVSICN